MAEPETILLTWSTYQEMIFERKIRLARIKELEEKNIDLTLELESALVSNDAYKEKVKELEAKLKEAKVFIREHCTDECISCGDVRCFALKPEPADEEKP